MSRQSAETFIRIVEIFAFKSCTLHAYIYTPDSAPASPSRSGSDPVEAECAAWRLIAEEPSECKFGPELSHARTLRRGSSELCSREMDQSMSTSPPRLEELPFLPRAGVRPDRLRHALERSRLACCNCTAPERGAFLKLTRGTIKVIRCLRDLEGCVYPMKSNVWGPDQSLV